MSIGTKESMRRPLPTWRLLTRGAMEPDLQGSGLESEVNRTDLQRKLNIFQSFPSFFNAYELYLSAFMTGDSTALEAALSYLEKCPDTPHGFLPRLTRSTANIVVPPSPSLSDEWVFSGIRSIRSRLRLEPNNPILQLDIAWLYAAIGESAPAYKAASIAVAKCFGSRPIVRRASRFFAHFDNRHRAYNEVLKAATATSDPWLIAAEISFAQVLGVNSSWEKKARRHLKQQRAFTSATCEMAASIGTLDAHRGNTKSAVKLINRSLIKKDENMLSQASWLKEKLNLIQIQTDNLDFSAAYEALARRESSFGNWDSCLKAVDSWIRDEPYSSRPYVFGSYVSATAIGDFKASFSYAEMGLRIDSDNDLLYNNMLVALMCQGGRGLEEQRAIRFISRQLKGKKTTSFATAGLMCFVFTDVENGRKFYERSLAQFKRLGDPLGTAIAQLYWAQSELLYGEHVRAKALLNVDLSKLASSDRKITEAMQQRLLCENTVRREETRRKLTRPPGQLTGLTTFLVEDD